MGTNNRKRRAAKTRDRRRDHARRDHRRSERDESEQVRTSTEDEQHRAVDAEFARVVDRLFDLGWTPHDLLEAARRKVSGRLALYVLTVSAELTERHSAGTVHPAWRAQLSALRGRSGEASSSAAWARRAGLAWPDAVEQLAELLVVLLSLPALEAVLPRPGSRIDAVSSGRGIDENVLRRVRALLAKAESTDFEEEADALTAKAQQLMTEHSIDRALAESAAGTHARPAVRRMWLDNPYLVAKSLLVGDVAEANHCRSVFSDVWGFATLVGHEHDLDVVELLSTSLLVQATRAMTLAGPQRRDGYSRTRSYRQSFLVAYAGRIGERLRESATATEACTDATHGGALLPLLVSRQRVVDDHFDELFPQLVHRRIRASNAAGWAAGRVAADLARFDVRDSLNPAAQTG